MAFERFYRKVKVCRDRSRISDLGQAGGFDVNLIKTSIGKGTKDVIALPVRHRAQ